MEEDSYSAFLIFSRHWIISAAPTRTASANSFYGQPASFENTVFHDSLNSILRTCRSETAYWREKRRYETLIEKDRQEKNASNPDHNDSFSATIAFNLLIASFIFLSKKANGSIF